MPTIIITVRNKVANTAGGQYYVCSNSDYTVTFDFDEEWAAYDVKTARFVHNSLHEDVVFSGNVCPFPKINDAELIHVGVYAGDLKTTTPAIVQARRSILSGSTTPTPPQEDVYSQIMEQLNRIDENIDESVSAALMEAKESGEFDGPKGDKGDPGETGAAFTYDMFTEEQLAALTGPKGEPGKDGILPEGYPGYIDDPMVIPATVVNVVDTAYRYPIYDLAIPLEQGAIYNVTLDGETRTLNAYKVIDQYGYKHPEVILGEDGSDLYMCYRPDYIYQGKKYLIFGSNTTGEHTVSVQLVGRKYEKIGYEYLPDGYPKILENPVILPDVVYEFSNDGIQLGYGQLSARKTYTVTLDGQEYTYTADYDSEKKSYELGQQGDPVYVTNLEGRILVKVAEPGEHKVRIQLIGSDTVPMSPDLLPEDSKDISFKVLNGVREANAYTDEKTAAIAGNNLVFTSPGGKKFKISVNDDGTLTTTEV